MVIKEFDVTPSFKLVTRVRTENKEIERFDELSINLINDPCILIEGEHSMRAR